MTRRAGGPAGALLERVWAGIAGGAGLALGLRRHARPASQDDRRALDERLGRAALGDVGPSPRLWLHASSVGEVGALAPLVAWLGARAPASLVVTTSTRTGLARAATLGVPAFLAPIDARAAVGRFVSALEPAAHVIVETEIWPSRLALLARREVPTVLVSARLSPERWPRYARARPLYARSLDTLRWLSPASSADAERFERLGVPRSRIRLEGNLKWDGAPGRPSPSELSELRSSLGLREGRPWIVLGSVHPGEAGDLVRALLGALPAAESSRDAGIVVAPRHPQRFADVAEELAALDPALHRLSGGPAPDTSRVVLLDRLGVLSRIYPLAAAAVMGGTFVPVGGHSPLEAAAGGCPLVSGPHDGHQRDLVAPLHEAGALARVDDAEAAANRLCDWLHRPEARMQASRAALAVVEARRGHAARLGEAILELLP